LNTSSDDLCGAATIEMRLEGYWNDR